MRSTILAPSLFDVPQKCSGEDLNQCVANFTWASIVLGLSFAFVCSWLPKQNTHPPTTETNLLANADNVWSLLVYPTLSVLSIINTKATYGSEPDHLGLVTPASHWFLIIYSSLSIIHIPISLLKEPKGKMTAYKYQMMMHHFLSLGTYVSVLYIGTLHFYSVAYGLCEICTMFLSNIFVLKMFQFPMPIQALNGILLWLSFVVFRILLFPYVYYLYASERAANLEKANTNIMLHVLNSATAFMLMILSLYWFIAITKGMIKTVKAGLQADPDEIVNDAQNEVDLSPKSKKAN
eukprot:m.54342 g.54342  ORF g.54342 m.54342 type:complete len:293 (+) comp10919_c1_seq2:466-1344(+)